MVATAVSGSAADQQKSTVPGSVATPLIKLRKFGPDLPGPLVVVRAPREGAIFAPGDTIDLQIEAIPDAKIASVTVFSRGDPQVAELTSFPATVHITVPIEEAGDFRIVLVSEGPGPRIGAVGTTQ